MKTIQGLEAVSYNIHIAGMPSHEREGVRLKGGHFAAYPRIRVGAGSLVVAKITLSPTKTEYIVWCIDHIPTGHAVRPDRLEVRK